MEYEYDAAGRLVKEGDKVYSYIGLDKIESVTEGGRKLSSFTYHIYRRPACCACQHRVQRDIPLGWPCVDPAQQHQLRQRTRRDRRQSDPRG